MALLALIAAMLLAILAAAGPMVASRVAREPPVAALATTKPASNVGIVRLAAIEHPRPQVMVTLKLESVVPSGSLKVVPPAWLRGQPSAVAGSTPLCKPTYKAHSMPARAAW